MSDRIGVFNQRPPRAGGDARRRSTTSPATRFVAEFVGAANVLHGAGARAVAGRRRRVMIRPELIRLGAARGAPRARARWPRCSTSAPSGACRSRSRHGDAAAGRPAPAVDRTPASAADAHLHWDAGAVHAQMRPWRCAARMAAPVSARRAMALPPRRPRWPTALSTLLYTRRGLLLAAAAGAAAAVVRRHLPRLAAGLLANSFFRLDDFSGQVVRELGLGNFIELFTPPTSTSPCARIAMAVAGHAGLRADRLPHRLLHGALRARRDARRCSTSP